MMVFDNIPEYGCDKITAALFKQVFLSVRDDIRGGGFGHSLQIPASRGNVPSAFLTVICLTYLRLFRGIMDGADIKHISVLGHHKFKVLAYLR